MKRLEIPREDRSKLFSWVPTVLHRYMKKEALIQDKSLTLLITEVFTDYKRCKESEGGSPTTS